MQYSFKPSGVTQAQPQQNSAPFDTSEPSSSHRSTAVVNRPQPVIQSAGFGAAGGVQVCMTRELLTPLVHTRFSMYNRTAMMSQGLTWYTNKLKQDRDGDVADEFLLEQETQSSEAKQTSLQVGICHSVVPQDAVTLSNTLVAETKTAPEIPKRSNCTGGRWQCVCCAQHMKEQDAPCWLLRANNSATKTAMPLSSISFSCTALLNFCRSKVGGEQALSCLAQVLTYCITTGNTRVNKSMLTSALLQDARYGWP